MHTIQLSNGIVARSTKKLPPVMSLLARKGATFFLKMSDGVYSKIDNISQEHPSANICVVSPDVLDIESQMNIQEAGAKLLTGDFEEVMNAEVACVNVPLEYKLLEYMPHMGRIESLRLYSRFKDRPDSEQEGMFKYICQLVLVGNEVALDAIGLGHLVHCGDEWKKLLFHDETTGEIRWTTD